MPLRDDGTLPCCGGFGGEHRSFCEVGAEIAHRQRLADQREVRRIADNDAGDRAWVDYSEACE